MKFDKKKKRLKLLKFFENELYFKLLGDFKVYTNIFRTNKTKKKNLL